MQWDEVPSVIDDWAVKAAAPAQTMRRAAAHFFAASPVGFYCHPDRSEVAAFAPLASAVDLERVKAAMHAVGPGRHFLSYQDLADPDGCWVKVAYSQSLRHLGEALNFFPGQYPNVPGLAGVPNAPSPLAAILTSGLLGAGLGWGGGKLLEHLLPRRFGQNLARTGLVAGGLLGAAPGAGWSLANVTAGRHFNDPGLLASPPREDADALPVPPMSERHKVAVAACIKAALDDRAVPDGVDVDINAVGQTLWQTDASPALAASTMSTLYAAQQLPDPASRPGWATGHQLGQLAMRAAGDYMKGLLVGAALNAAVGTPFGAQTFGLGNAALGVISAVVPKLYGG